MSQIRLIRVFLSSPGDVTEERQIALEVIERLPNRPAFREKVTFRIIAWDKPESGTAMRGSLTPQEAIVKGLPRPSVCDIVIVLFWSRMGTPFTDEDGKDYLSGTHWELLDALSSRDTETLIYHRTEEKRFNAHDDEGREQYLRLEEFLKSDLFYKAGKILRGVNDYSTPDDFGKQFETHFEELVVELLRRPALEVPSQPVEQRPPPMEKIEPLQQPAMEAAPEPALEDTSNITTIATSPWLGSPFPGLRAFTPADAPIYFGRRQETDVLVQRVTASQFVAVVGASGSGKSSLVGAGLIPRLKANAILGSQDWVLPDWNADVRQWVGPRFTPGEVGDNPFMALALKLAPLTNDTPRELSEKLARNPGALTESCAQLLKNKPDWAEVLLFIDQFEELFTLIHPRYVTPFVDLLEIARKSQQICTVATLRADFYARCVEIPKLADILEGTTHPLSAPTHVELREMIARPAEQAGLEFDEGLPERILDDTGVEPGALALMAYALDELYQSGAGDQRLTRVEYEALGGVQGAIGRRAETIFIGLPIEAQAALPTVFREIVEVDERGEPTRRRAELKTVAPNAAAKQLVDALTGERARLLVQDKDMQGRPMVEVAHEALLRQWPRLRGWIEKQQDNLRLRRQIQQAAQEWEAHGRAVGYLLMGSRLEDAERWLKVFSAGQLESEFIAASVEAEARQKKSERRIRQIAAGLGVLLLVVLVGIAATAIIQSNQAQADLATAQSQGTLDAFPQLLRQTQLAGITPFIIEQTRDPETVVAMMSRVAELDAWTPTPRTFDDDVEMVQVPPGCFLMGGTGNGDELPLHEQCFEEPFWIDRFEVTNEQFEQFGGAAMVDGRPGDWPDPEQPRTSVTWFEARDFCDARDGATDDPPDVGVRLPTEREWEYAARGLNSLVYPWGNEFVADDAVYRENSGGETAVVGSKTEGMSWAGAYDMSGNVWEWVSTIYDNLDGTGEFPYPYDPTDGRENPDDTTSSRLLRGGSFDDFGNVLRAALRGWSNPDNSNPYFGFRCARSE